MSPHLNGVCRTVVMGVGTSGAGVTGKLPTQTWCRSRVKGAWNGGWCTNGQSAHPLLLQLVIQQLLGGPLVVLQHVLRPADAGHQGAMPPPCNGTTNHSNQLKECGGHTAKESADRAEGTPGNCLPWVMARCAGRAAASVPVAAAVPAAVPGPCLEGRSPLRSAAAAWRGRDCTLGMCARLKCSPSPTSRLLYVACDSPTRCTRSAHCGLQQQQHVHGHAASHTWSTDLCGGSPCSFTALIHASKGVSHQVPSTWAMRGGILTAACS